MGRKMLSDMQLTRYARQIFLNEVGEEGQEKILAARVLVVGAGGLGVPIASYLAAAGVGALGIADDDTVDLRNLHRQVVYGRDDIGKPKTVRLKGGMQHNNFQVNVVEHGRISRQNADDIIGHYDWVCDGCDNFPTRYLVNAACVRLRKPLVSGALSRFTGQLAAYQPDGPCYQCAFPVSPDSEEAQGCVDGGILGPMAGLVGCWQALEVLKQILELPMRLQSELLLFDGMNYLSRRIALQKNPSCDVCGE